MAWRGVEREKVSGDDLEGESSSNAKPETSPATAALNCKQGRGSYVVRVLRVVAQKYIRNTHNHHPLHMQHT